MELGDVYVEIIPASPTNHPCVNNAICVYIKQINGEKGYLIPIDHCECINLDIFEVQELLNSIQHIYVIDKKEYLHYFTHKNITSISKIRYNKHFTTAHNILYIDNPDLDNINSIIPVVKHYEMCENNFQELKGFIEPSTTPSFYDKKSSIVFNIIESCGIKIDKELFKEHFYETEDDLVYTQYNLSTLTTRPSNSFKNINFAALNKENGEKKCFIPSNDIFIEMDISAYHPSILANILDYTFTDSDIHSYFAKIYDVDYAKSKQITFQQMYGGVWKEYEEVEFFKRMKIFTQKLWNEFNQQGYIICPISGHRFEKESLIDMNPQKLLNYLLQNQETSINVLILWDILKLLQGKKTKLILYTYDGFTFDVDKSEKPILKQITEIFTKYKFSIKYKSGKSLDFH